jgi:hypothetical protein
MLLYLAKLKLHTLFLRRRYTGVIANRNIRDFNSVSFYFINILLIAVP